MPTLESPKRHTSEVCNKTNSYLKIDEGDQELKRVLKDLIGADQSVKSPEFNLDVPLSGYDRLLQDFISQK